MDDIQIEHIIKKLLAIYLDTLDDEINQYQTLAELGLDSVDAVHLVIDIEKEFGIQFLPEQMPANMFSNLNTLKNAVRLAMGS